MNYLEQLKKRNELLEQADNVMTIYINIADRLYSKATSKWTGIINMEITDKGILYEYYIDAYDYSAGTNQFFVGIETLEKLAEKELRAEKLKKIHENTIK